MIRLIITVVFLAAVCRLAAGLAPLTIKEMSLMLRSGYSSDAVLVELAKRKCVDALDATSEKQLVQLGASQALIGAIHSGTYRLSSAETEAWENQKQNARTQNSSQSSSEQQAAKPNPPPQQQQIGGTMYEHFKDELVYSHEGTLVPVDNEILQKKKFYLLFFSGFWSKEGRQFTSQLIDYYNRVIPRHPELEVVFFSVDRSAFAMEDYMSKTSMPWPALAYDKRDGKAGAIQGSLVRQIPQLILAEASGKILSDSAADPAGLDKVLAETDKVLAGN